MVENNLQLLKYLGGGSGGWFLYFSMISSTVTLSNSGFEGSPKGFSFFPDVV